MRTLLAFLCSQALGLVPALGARSFNGSTDSIVTSSVPGSVTGAPISVSAWFNSTTIASDQTVVAITDTAGDSNYFQLCAGGGQSGDPVYIATRTTTNIITPTSTSYSTNTWTHACGVWAAINSRAVYKDGGGKGTSTTSVTPAGLDIASIGRHMRLTPASPFSGNIAEVAIWNVALSDTDVANLAQGFSPRLIRPDKLIFYAPLVNDLVEIRGGLTLTATGTSVVAHPRIYRTASLRTGLPPFARKAMLAQFVMPWLFSR